MRSAPVCVDASLVVKPLVPEAGSDRAERLWQGWLEQRVQILAPVLPAFEAPSALRKQVQRGLFSAERGRKALEAFEALSANVELASPEGLHGRAGSWPPSTANPASAVPITWRWPSCWSAGCGLRTTACAGPCRPQRVPSHPWQTNAKRLRGSG